MSERKPQARQTHDFLFQLLVHWEQKKKKKMDHFGTFSALTRYVEYARYT